MHSSISHPLPTSGRLLKSTALAVTVAGVLLITTVLPAEYGIDPTGIGTRLGLGVLASTAEATDSAPDVAETPTAAGDSDSDAANGALTAKAAAAFGDAEGQSFDAGAVSANIGGLRRDRLTLTLPPGKGAEIKARLGAGDGMVFKWNPSQDVAVDMHGERPDVKGAWTSYAVETAQREGAGTFVAPFDGTHGWYWQNRGTAPVTVSIEVVGFQPALYRP